MTQVLGCSALEAHSDVGGHLGGAGRVLQQSEVLRWHRHPAATLGADHERPVREHVHGLTDDLRATGSHRDEPGSDLSTQGHAALATLDEDPVGIVEEPFLDAVDLGHDASWR